MLIKIIFAQIIIYIIPHFFTFNNQKGVNKCQENHLIIYKQIHNNFGPIWPEVPSASNGVFLYPNTNKTMEVIRLCNFLRVQLVPYRPLLWLLARALLYGVLSTFWKVTGRIIPARNRKESSSSWPGAALSCWEQRLYLCFPACFKVGRYGFSHRLD